LFRAPTVPGHLPFRAFPSQRSCTPLEATGSPAVIHPGARARYGVTFRLLFHRLPRAGRSCLVPQPTMGSLSTCHEGPLPVHPESRSLRSRFPRLHLPRSFTPSANPFSPSRRTGFRRSLLSWSFALLETLLEPRNLYPPRTRSRACSQHVPRPESLELATVRTLRPSPSGGTSSTPNDDASVSSAASDPLRAGPYHLAVVIPTLLTFSVTLVLQLVSRALKYSRSDGSPKRSARLFQGFLPPRGPHSFGAWPTLAYLFTAVALSTSPST
jgi:hypothetical protein